MEPVLRINENREEMHELINAQRETLDRQLVRNIEHSDLFSLGAIREEELAVRMNPQQTAAMRRYRDRQEQYQRALEELEHRRNQPDWTLNYNLIWIQIIQNNMEMHLLMASVLGRGPVTKRIRAESLTYIIGCRNRILEYYDGLQNLDWQQERSRAEQAAEIAREEAVQKEAVSEFNLRVLTAAALSGIQEERNQPEDAAEAMNAFLEADFSTKVLEADYVIQHMADCLQKAELIRRAEAINPEQLADEQEAQYAAVRNKLEAVSEYVNVVESVLWEYGLKIDYDHLQISEITESDVDFAKRRWAYRTNGVSRFYFGAREYRHRGENGEQIPDENQEDPLQTRSEKKYDGLETKLGIRGLVDDHIRMIRARGRNLDELIQVNPGEEISASTEDAQGVIEDWQVKRRFFRIYQLLRNRITQKLADRREQGAEAFQDLGAFVYQYVRTNRVIYENRREAEENEAKALARLKDALVRVQRFAKNKCSKYAAILLGLLNEDNSGYLEVPSDGVLKVEDDDIALGRRKIPGISLIREYRDCTDMPLFTHRPNIKDVEQGYLGDCYLLAGLISVVDRDAEEIMNIMRDNGNGTVTVRFMRRERQAGGRIVYTPYYVTVKKTIPVYKIVGRDTFSRGALWVKMMEKAYAASGLHPTRGGQRNQRDYDDIIGGGAGEFIGLLLGKEIRRYVPYKNSADRISMLLPAAQEPPWDPEGKYGNENVHSIVYEFIQRRFAGAENMFLHMRRLDRNDPDYERRYADYVTMQGCVKSCRLHLYIIDALAREQGTDILKLDSQRKIERWYEKLKTIFRHYDTNRRNRNAALNSNDKIMSRLQRSCIGTDVEEEFRNITPGDFECTVDVLKDRHIELLRRNQQERQGGVNINAAQNRHDYYTERDRRLYASINRTLQAGSYITFGTRKFKGRGTGLNGETESDGLVGGHAYAILNTRRVQVNGREYLFFVVMNPWAEKGVVYQANPSGIRKRAIRGERQGERGEGVFLLDIKTFAETVSHWDIVPA